MTRCSAAAQRWLPDRRFFSEHRYARVDMAPEDIKKLREELRCTARELGGALGLDQETVFAWERGDLFPTKRFVGMMEELRHKGPDAIPRKKKKSAPAPLHLLADPDLWRIFRKVLVHQELRTAVLKLAEAYTDPAEEPPS
jgi:DNA-binding transcriptional regulator YiaG